MLGFLNVDKPYAVTSHDVVAKVRRKLGEKHIGHAGTLDPLASGVLILCVGPAARLSEYVMHSTKRYLARVHLGVVTDSYDREGEIIARSDITHLTEAQVQAALAPFMGDIQQIPPMHSAIKQGGRKLYKMARAGEIVEREPRPVRIDTLTLNAWEPPYITLDVTCSSGTYIRSLAFDLGEALGVGAHLAGLVRERSGSFARENAVPLDALIASRDPAVFLTPPRADLLNMFPLTLDEYGVRELRFGRTLPITDDVQPGQLALALAEDRELIAVVRAEDGLWKPEKVFLG